MLLVFHTILPIFAITLFGFILRRKFIKSDDFWSGLEILTFYLFLPSLIFYHITSSNIEITRTLFILPAIILPLISVMFIIVICRYFISYDKIKFTSIFQGVTRYNGYILFTITSKLFDAKRKLYCSKPHTIYRHLY